MLLGWRYTIVQRGVYLAQFRPAKGLMLLGILFEGWLMSIVFADKGVQIRRGRRHVHDQSQIGSQVTKLFPVLAFLTLTVLV